MKKITLLLVTIVTLTSCSKESVEQLSEEALTSNPINTTNDRREEPGPSIDPIVTDLIAGQNEIVGTVTVETDGTTINVTYNTINGWEIDATHLYVGDCESRPANNPGNPLIGQFPYKEIHNSGTTEYMYSISSAEVGCSGCVAAHAEVRDINGGTETAWADGLPYGGSSWAMYFEYNFCQ